jgi:hypothetical protein
LWSQAAKSFHILNIGGESSDFFPPRQNKSPQAIVKVTKDFFSFAQTPQAAYGTILDAFFNTIKS